MVAGQPLVASKGPLAGEISPAFYWENKVKPFLFGGFLAIIGLLFTYKQDFMPNWCWYAILATILYVPVGVVCARLSYLFDKRYMKTNKYELTNHYTGGILVVPILLWPLMAPILLVVFFFKAGVFPVVKSLGIEQFVTGDSDDKRKN